MDLRISDNNAPVAVIVDSAASVPDEFRASPLTFVVPMRLHIGDRTYRDGVDISTDEFYRIQKRRADIATTSAPAPADFLEAYEAASQVAEQALTVVVSGTFSASKRSADAALERFREARPTFEARSLDSWSAAGGQGLVAWEALKESLGGASLGIVEARALEIRERVRLLAYVDTLYYLWKSGRAPGIARAGASLLKLKPIFELSQSQVRGVAKPRTNRRALERLVALVAERVGEATASGIVMHAEAEEMAERLRDSLRARLDCAELFLAEFTPVMGAHIGPGMVGVAFWSEER